MKQQIALLKAPRFWPLFWTQFLGAFNDNLFRNALVILIAYRGVHVFGVSPQQMVAVAGGVLILPFFLFSTLAGQVADRYEKSQLIRYVKLAEVLIMLLGAAGFLIPQFEFLLVVLFLMGLHSTFFGPLKYSILPELVPPEQILAANALVEAGTFLAILLGGIAGGLLIAAENGPLWASIGAVSVAAIGVWTSRRVPVVSISEPGLQIDRVPFRMFAKLYHILKSQPGVHLSVIGISWFWFIGSCVLALIPTLCKDVFSAPESVVTTFLAMFSIGVGLGSMACEVLVKKTSLQNLVRWSGFVMGIGCALLAFEVKGISSFVLSDLQGPQLRVLLYLFVLAAAGGFFAVPLYTNMQVLCSPQVRSRVVAANNIQNALFIVISAVLVVALFAAKISIPDQLLIFAGLQILFVLGWFQLLRRSTT